MTLEELVALPTGAVILAHRETGCLATQKKHDGTWLFPGGTQSLTSGEVFFCVSKSIELLWKPNG